jgi:hypothetical protein
MKKWTCMAVLLLSIVSCNASGDSDLQPDYGTFLDESEGRVTQIFYEKDRTIISDLSGTNWYMKSLVVHISTDITEEAYLVLNVAEGTRETVFLTEEQIVKAIEALSSTQIEAQKTISNTYDKLVTVYKISDEFSVGYLQEGRKQVILIVLENTNYEIKESKIRTYLVEALSQIRSLID